MDANEKQLIKATATYITKDPGNVIVLLKRYGVDIDGKATPKEIGQAVSEGFYKNKNFTADFLAQMTAFYQTHALSAAGDTYFNSFGSFLKDNGGKLLGAIGGLFGGKQAASAGSSNDAQAMQAAQNANNAAMAAMQAQIAANQNKGMSGSTIAIIAGLSIAAIIVVVVIVKK